MSQKIQHFDISELVLWTENPRDPIDRNAKDQDIANKAWKDEHEKWNLLKLVREMRSHYDLSELPTVVMSGTKPIVYDGNRRMILAKLKHGHVKLKDFDLTKLPDIPTRIPCNVCSLDIAVQNVFRKHGDSGSWSPLDRDLFLHKFMKEPKSAFLQLDDSTKLISSNPHLNKVFVKNEIFTTEKLKELGFELGDDKLLSKHSKEETESILLDISKKVAAKKITTRENRGMVVDVLDKRNRDFISNNNENTFKKISVRISPEKKETQKKQSARTKHKAPELFNGILYLKSGQVSDFYRDIVDLYTFYCQNQQRLSQYFPSLIRMSMRLLCEAAAADHKQDMSTYLKTNFKQAKSTLSSDAKTTLNTQNVSEGTIIPLLHIGAHNYRAGNNIGQTVAVSIILGGILQITHGK
ncbi:MAG: hypothetical protein U0V75_00205 [Ferruginibacter sp.]